MPAPIAVNPAERHAPEQREMTPEQQRLERITSLLTRFGIDVASLDEALRSPMMNARTPLETPRQFYLPSDPASARDVAYSLSGAVVGGSSLVANNCRDVGMAAFCGSDEETSDFIGKVLIGLSMLEGEQDMSRDTRSWLMNDGMAFSRYALAGMSRGEQRRWLDENIDSLVSASIFQAWAAQKGIDQVAIDDAGLALFGNLWSYGRAIGSQLQMGDNGWYLSSQGRRRESSPTVLVSAEFQALPSVLAARVPVRTGAETLEMPPEDEFQFAYGSIVSLSEGVSVGVLGGRGWARPYGRFLRDLGHEQVVEATTFFVWARDISAMDEAERDRVGRARYGDAWEVATTIGALLVQSERTRGVYVMPLDNVDAAKAALAELKERFAAGRPTAAVGVAAAEEMPAEVRARAEELGVNADFFYGMVRLLRAGYNINLFYGGESDNARLENTLPWIEGIFSKPISDATGPITYYVMYNEQILPPNIAGDVVASAASMARELGSSRRA